MGDQEDALLEEAMDWWMGDDSLSQALDGFAASHCEQFPDPNPDGSCPEQGPALMLLYQEFQALIEKHLEAFLKEKGIAVDEFFQMCQRRSDRSEVSPFVQWMVATTTYEQFWRTMTEEKEQRKG